MIAPIEFLTAVYEQARADERRGIIQAIGYKLEDLDLDPSRDDVVHVSICLASAAAIKYGEKLASLGTAPTRPLFDSIHNSEQCNLRGEYGEALARLFFVQHGFRVAESGGDHYPYDMIVERHDESLRVQVKTTSRTTCKGDYYRVSFGMSDGFDLALIITELGEVYVIPQDEISFESPNGKRRQFVLYPSFEQFKLGTFRGFVPTIGGSTELVISKLEELSGIHHAG